MENAQPVSRRLLAVCAVTGVGLVVLSMVAAFQFHSADGGATEFAFKWLSLPLLAIWLTVAFRTDVLGRAPIRKIVSAIILTVFFCSIGGSGLLMWLNTGLGRQVPFLVDGTIARKNSGGIKGYPTVTVLDANGLNPVRLEVTRREYNSVEVGQPYRKQMRIGSLGIMYAPVR